MYKIPADPAWCSYCIVPGAYGNAPCEHHKGGAPYAGHDVYEPSDWVKETVGKVFVIWGDEFYRCFGFDPRHGFWMENLVTGEKKNISGRAIGRTYHQVMYYSPTYRHCLEKGYIKPDPGAPTLSP